MATPGIRELHSYDPVPSDPPSAQPIVQAAAGSIDPYTPIEEALGQTSAPPRPLINCVVDLKTLRDSETRSDALYMLEQAADPQAVVWASKEQVMAMTQGIAFPVQDKEALKLMLTTYHSAHCERHQKPALFRMGSKGNLVLTYYNPETRECGHTEISMSPDGDRFCFPLLVPNTSAEPWLITAGNLFQRLEYFVIYGQSTVKDLHLVQKDPRFSNLVAGYGHEVIIHQVSALAPPPKLGETINVTQLYPYLNDGCMPLVPIDKARKLAKDFFAQIPRGPKTLVVFTVGSHPTMICRKPDGEVVAYRIYADKKVERFAIEDRAVATKTTMGGLTNRLIETITNDPNGPYRHDDPKRRDHFEVHQVAFRRFCESQGVPCQPSTPTSER